MQTGALTQYIDIAQLALYGFWIFFAGLIWYLHREDKREGYPLDSDRTERSGGRVLVQGFPAVPSPKVFRLADGSTVTSPPANGADRRPIAARPVGNGEGAALDPTGNPMVDGVGPAAWAERADVPERMTDGSPMIVPMSAAPGFVVSARDPDPRGMSVVGCDGNDAGTVRELWVDRAEPQIRYLEVELAAGGRRLLPAGFVRYDVAHRRVKVASITAAQFAAVPQVAGATQITKREEDRITGYYAGGHLYATPDRLGPWL